MARVHAKAIGVAGGRLVAVYDVDQSMPQDSIDLLVRRALRGAEVVVASPAAIQKGIEKGEPITEPADIKIFTKDVEIVTHFVAHSGQGGPSARRNKEEVNL